MVALPPSRDTIKAHERQCKMDTKAIEDGVTIVETEWGNTDFGYGIIKRGYYLIPCEVCGEDVKNGQFSRERNYLCDRCKISVKKKEKIAHEYLEGIFTPCEKRFAKAVENIKKQVRDFSKYENAIKIAKSRLEKYGSVPEAMVAIELLKNKHRIIPQQKVGKYKVDFALPDIKKIIEVDGELYHRNNRSPNREGTIQISMGMDWKILHIPAKLIAKDIAKLERAINLVN